MKSSEEVHLSSELFLFHLFSSAVFYSSDYAEEADFLMEITIPLGVPADLQSAVKKCSTYKQRGICNPPIKGKAYSFAADFKSAK